MLICVTLFFLLLVLAVLALFLAHGLDRFRVQESLESRGGTLLEMRLETGEKRWFDLVNERSYVVRYQDSDEHTHQTIVTTSLWKGVNWGADAVVQFADQTKTERSLEKEKKHVEDENEFLRRQIEDMKMQMEEDADLSFSPEELAKLESPVPPKHDNSPE